MNRFVKYYKSLMLGFIDMVLVNCYIVQSILREKRRLKRLTHLQFLTNLHAALVQESEASFVNTTIGETSRVRVRPEQPIRVSQNHALVKTKEQRMVNGKPRTVQRVCKVCTRLRDQDDKTRTTSMFYCATCSAGKKGKVWLCNQVRDHPENPGLTCSQIYHLVWHNGEFAPNNRMCRDRRAQGE